MLRLELYHEIHSVEIDVGYQRVLITPRIYFISMLILRLFPRALHRLISSFLPSSWLIHIYLRRAQSYLVPIIEERLKKRETLGEETEKPLDLLQYMIEVAEGEDLQPERLAHLQLMSNLAAIHTSSMAITHAIYDLCEHQEYVQVLREEVEQVLRDDDGWQRDTHNKLHKIDSFLKESQRFAPAKLCEASLICSRGTSDLGDHGC